MDSRSKALQDLCNKAFREEQELHENICRKLLSYFGYPADYLVRNYEQGERKEFLVNGVVCATIEKKTGDLFSSDYSVEYVVGMLPDGELRRLAEVDYAVGNV